MPLNTCIQLPIACMHSNITKCAKMPCLGKVCAHPRQVGGHGRPLRLHGGNAPRVLSRAPLAQLPCSCRPSRMQCLLLMRGAAINVQARLLLQWSVGIGLGVDGRQGVCQAGGARRVLLARCRYLWQADIVSSAGWFCCRLRCNILLSEACKCSAIGNSTKLLCHPAHTVGSSLPPFGPGLFWRRLSWAVFQVCLVPWLCWLPPQQACC